MPLILSRPFEPPVATPLVARASVHSGISYGANLVNATPQGPPGKNPRGNIVSKTRSHFSLRKLLLAPALRVNSCVPMRDRGQLIGVTLENRKVLYSNFISFLPL